jgi:hypothetical protein
MLHYGAQTIFEETLVLARVSNPKQDQDWMRIRIGFGSRQAKIVLKKRKKRSFMFEDFSVWAGGFSWNLNVLCRGLGSHK